MPSNLWRVKERQGKYEEASIVHITQTVHFRTSSKIYHLEAITNTTRSRRPLCHSLYVLRYRSSLSTSCRPLVLLSLLLLATHQERSPLRMPLDSSQLTMLFALLTTGDSVFNNPKVPTKIRKAQCSQLVFREMKHRISSARQTSKAVYRLLLTTHRPV